MKSRVILTNLTIEEREVRDPSPNEVRVRVQSSGLNRADLLQKRGHYPAPAGDVQDVLGLEYAGRVEAVGSGVTTRKVGDAVMGIVGGGGYSEHLVVPAAATVPIPRGIDPVTAGAIPEAFFTAYDALFVRGDLKAGETVLVHAVASGVGTAAVQLARWAGASVIGTSRTADKLDRVKPLGLTRGVVSSEGWEKDVQDVDVVIDLVGGTMVQSSTKILRDRGRHVLVGLTAGAKTDLDLGALLRKRLTLVGTVLRSRPEDEKQALARAITKHVVPAFESRQLTPVLESTISPDKVARAHERLEQNATFGKIVIDWT